MNKPKSTMARQIAKAAIAFEQRRTGNHVPKSVTIVLSEGTLVITLYEALSPAERVLAQSPAGAAKMQEFHRQLFANTSNSLRRRSEESPGGRSARRLLKSSRRAAPWYRHLQPAPWCKSFSLPATRQRKHGPRVPRENRSSLFMVRSNPNDRRRSVVAVERENSQQSRTHRMGLRHICSNGRLQAVMFTAPAGTEFQTTERGLL